MRMCRAILFDFNGVIADDEPAHILCFQQALADYGLALTADEYYGRFLGMDERTCAQLLLKTRDGVIDEGLLRTIIEHKAQLFQTYTAQHKPTLFPGVVEFVQRAALHYRLAVASGGRREQILSALAGTDLERAFEVVVAAEDCAIGKPDPAIYLLTLDRLNTQAPQLPPIQPKDCLVIEDSRAGIQAGRAAGMTVVALSTTYPASQLIDAALVLPSLRGVSPQQLSALLPAAEGTTGLQAAGSRKPAPGVDSPSKEA